MERGADGSLAPHVSDRLQVELRMLDPYVRTTLAHRGNGTYRAEVAAPDVYGVFKWELRSDRRGWSSVREAVVVPIRPFRHDEYDRFILQAYPYYASAIVMMASFLLASGLFLYSQP
ncbi:oligosaccharyltransferase [Helicosporidium sp. ATCC 50920]|nr:oligosaccharyltransferase [Helicosporidium sp. ATCC 50920]|eukprot:KDD72919.1 oligosaccharyltransferase [Helicosporidium sp. ATCC 50920]